MAQNFDFSPRIISHPENCEVHSRLLLVKGTCGSNANGNIIISAHDDNFPKQSFPVQNGEFKALIHLTPGKNIIELSFNDGNKSWISSWTVEYVPLLENPPLHLCIIVGSDSPLTYDDVPDCVNPPNLETAIKKLRLAGYLWQAYTGSQMYSNGFRQRVFRLDESHQIDTLSSRDQTVRNTAIVHVLRSKYTTVDIHDPQRAQQNQNADNKNSLFDIALEAIRPVFTEERNYIAALFLDSHYENGLITGHAALGLGGADVKHSLAIFGSHTLFSWPTSLENIIPCFMDTRSVNKNYCGIDGEGSIYWIACNVGIGAMLHEVGHLFGCPHQRNGVMMRDYIRLNRSFSVIEPPGPSFLNGKECSWHRLDLLRFLVHPCFGLPTDPICKKGDIQIFGTDQGVLIKSASSLVVVEVYLNNDEFPQSWIEFIDQPFDEVVLSQEQLRNHAGGKGKIKINVIASNRATASVDDIEISLHAEHVPKVGKVWKTAALGLQTGTPSSIVFPSDSMTSVRVYSGLCLDGIEFFTQQESFFFGKRGGGSPHDFPMEKDEFIIGFGVRSGAWIDALQIITNRRRSQWFGNTDGGSSRELMLPNDNHRIYGVYGEINQWVVQIGMQYCIKQ